MDESCVSTEISLFSGLQADIATLLYLKPSNAT